MSKKLLKINFVDAGIWWDKPGKEFVYKYLGGAYNKLNGIIDATNFNPFYNYDTRKLTLDSSVVSNILHTLLGKRPIPYKQLRAIEGIATGKTECKVSAKNKEDFKSQISDFVKLWNSNEDKHLLDIAQRSFVKVNSYIKDAVSDSKNGKPGKVYIQASPETIYTSKLNINSDADSRVIYNTKLGPKHIKHTALTWEGLELYFSGSFKDYFSRYKQLMYKRYLKDVPSGKYFTVKNIIEMYNHETNNPELNRLIEEVENDPDLSTSAFKKYKSFFLKIVTCYTPIEILQGYWQTSFFGKNQLDSDALYDDEEVKEEKAKDVRADAKKIINKYKLSRDKVIEGISLYRTDPSFLEDKDGRYKKLAAEKSCLTEMLSNKKLKAIINKDFKVNNEGNPIIWTKRSSSCPTAQVVASTRVVSKRVDRLQKLSGSILIPVDEDILKKLRVVGYNAVSMLEGGIAYIEGVVGNNTDAVKGYEPVNVRDWVDNTPEVKK